MEALTGVLCLVVIFVLIAYIRRIRRDIKHLKRLKALENNGNEMPVPRSIGEWERRAEESQQQSLSRRHNGGTVKK
jgi:hypothetical protein